MITLPPPRSSYFDEHHECLVDLRPMEMGMMRKTRRGELGGKKKENRMGRGVKETKTVMARRMGSRSNTKRWVGRRGRR